MEASATPKYDIEHTRSLIEEARAGKRAAYEELFKTYRDGMSRQLGGKIPDPIRDRVEASDVVQEALIDAVSHFDSFRYQGPGSFRRWLARILQNRLRMTIRFHLQRKKRSPRREVPIRTAESTSGTSSRLGGVTLEARIASPESVAAVRERREIIEKTLRDLPSDYREVIRLVKLEEKSLANAAEKLGRSENAVKKLLARALLRYGEALKETGQIDAT